MLKRAGERGRVWGGEGGARGEDSYLGEGESCIVVAVNLLEICGGCRAPEVRADAVRVSPSWKSLVPATRN